MEFLMQFSFNIYFIFIRFVLYINFLRFMRNKHFSEYIRVRESAISIQWNSFSGLPWELTIKISRWLVILVEIFATYLTREIVFLFHKNKLHSRVS